MAQNEQPKLFSPVNDLDAVSVLLTDMHHDLIGKVARFRQLCDLSLALGSRGTLLPGGEVAYSAWMEARSSFVHGNYIATVQLCQGLAEHVLAAHLASGLDDKAVPDRISFQETIRRSIAEGVLTDEDADHLRQLMALRNPLAHYRSVNDPSGITRRAINTQQPAEAHLLNDATFALSVAIRLLALPQFRLGDAP